MICTEELCNFVSFMVYTQDGVNPLYAASKEGHTDVVDVLLRAGVDASQPVSKVCENLLQHS